MRERYLVSIVPAAILIAGAVAVAAGHGAARDGSVESATAAPASTQGAGHVLIATGGYHFTVPKDFNGGIFGTMTPIVNRLTFNAKRDADGTVSGWYTYEQEADGAVFRFSGPVTCLRIYDTPVLERTPEVPPLAGNRAKWGGRVEMSNDPTIPPGTFIWFQSIDNGEGANGWTDVSTLSGFGDEAANDAFCTSDRVPNPNFGPHPVGGGNVQVH
jgi:hypothetical protein